MATTTLVMAVQCQGAMVGGWADGSPSHAAAPNWPPPLSLLSKIQPWGNNKLARLRSMLAASGSSAAMTITVTPYADGPGPSPPSPERVPPKATLARLGACAQVRLTSCPYVGWLTDKHFRAQPKYRGAFKRELQDWAAWVQHAREQCMMAVQLQRT